MVNGRGPQKATKPLKINVYGPARPGIKSNRQHFWGRGKEADDMRSCALIVLASFTALG